MTNEGAGSGAYLHIPSADEEKKSYGTSVRLTVRLRRELDEYAQKKGRTRSELIESFAWFGLEAAKRADALTPQPETEKQRVPQRKRAK